MKDPLQMLAEDANLNPQIREIYRRSLKPSPAIGEFSIQDAHRLRAALQSIAALDPAATDAGNNVVGNALCFDLAQTIARAALAQETKA